MRVRSREEILATLDDKGDGRKMPFMPEMLEFCGQELEVFARSDKTCDSIDMTGATRKMEDTVHLLDTRCDGSAHGGCQAQCLLFWREEWLEPVDGQPRQPAPLRKRPVVSAPVTEQTLTDATSSVDDEGVTVYRCQATEVLRASTELSPTEMKQYVEDVRSRNVKLGRMMLAMGQLAFNRYQRLSHRLPRVLRVYGGRQYPFIKGTGDGKRTPTIGLQVGDLVEVKPKAEIMPTINEGQRNRGMWFDAEMLPYCGTQARVSTQVTRIIDEKTGRMLKLSDCVILDGVVCNAIYHRFCQRATPIYWREAWLRKVDDATSDTVH